MRLLPSLLRSFLCAAPLAVAAQPPVAGVAHGGHQGIFVVVGDAMPRPAGPVTRYRIERRTDPDAPFKEVAALTPIGSARELGRELERAGKAVPYPVHAAHLPIDSLWKAMQGGERRHLGPLYNDMPMLLACRLAWHDAQAKQGQRYQYRVVPEGGTPLLSTWTTAGEGGTPVAARPITGRYWEHQQRMELHYRLVGMPRPGVFALWRSDDGGAFIRVDGPARADLHGDTVDLVLVDTTVARYRPLRYMLQAWDPFGHAAPAGDTLYTASLDPTQMPMPTHLRADADSSGRAIRVQWQLPNAPLVKQLTLLRSTNSQEGFMPIATLAADQTAYIDRQVKPATSYFYHFVLEYKATHMPMRSPLFAANVYDPTPPLPPQELSITHAQGRPQLHWTHMGDHIASFQVYRGADMDPLELLVPRVEAMAGPQRYTWTDTTSLRPGHMYRYALRTVSTSHVQGPMSDTVDILPDLPPEAPPVPRELTVEPDGRLLLVHWEDLAHTPHFLGYELVRTRTPQRGQPVHDTLLVTVNHVHDTVPGPGVTCTYRVRSLTRLGGISAFTPPVEGRGRFAPLAPPHSLHARRDGRHVELTWYAGPDGQAVRYEVRRQVQGGTPELIGEVGAAQALRFTDAHAPDGACFYRVRAIDATGRTSDWTRGVRAE